MRWSDPPPLPFTFGGPTGGVSNEHAGRQPMYDNSKSAGTLPRVSLILLAYNQEQYVADAIRGALEQDYPNLEIVISDDCSVDRTFEIARELLDGNSWPHAVRINRTKSNCGILAHLYEAVSLSSGRYIVVGAADDISLPHRVSSVVDCFISTGADAVFSSWNVIDEHGQVVRAGRPPEDKVLDLSAYFPGQRVRQITGVTSAYSRCVFDAISKPKESFPSEDLFFTLMLHLRSRRIESLDQVLVCYRRHSAAVTHRTLEGQSLADVESRAQRYAKKVCRVLEYLEQAAVSGSGSNAEFGMLAPVDLERLRADITFQNFRSQWMEASFVERLRALKLVSSVAQLRWLGPRLFGLRGLLLARRLRDALGSGAEAGA